MSIGEAEIRKQALKELASAPGGRLTTSELIERLTLSMNPQGQDAELLANRGDTYFSQKVRNLVSHRGGVDTGLEANGLALYDAPSESWTITAAGLALASSL